MKILVFAGNAAQFQKFLHEAQRYNIKRGDCLYVSSVEQLKGFDKCYGVPYGEVCLNKAYRSKEYQRLIDLNRVIPLENFSMLLKELNIEEVPEFLEINVHSGTKTSERIC